MVGLFIAKSSTVEKWPAVKAKLDAVTPLDGSAAFIVRGADPRFAYGDDAPPSGMLTLTQTIPRNGERPEVAFTVAMDPSGFNETLRSFAFAIAALVAAGAALVTLLGYRIARSGLGPLRRMTEDAQAIGPKNPGQRLDKATLPRELSDLATSFNGALDRMQRAYAQVEAFNADVAHELRTPITNVVGQTQVALSKGRSAAELEEVLSSNLEEMERLRAIVNDMLFLARADRGETARERVPASAAAEIEKTVEFLEVVALDAGIAVRVEGDARAAVEPSLFRRAVSNLLLNAVEHSGPGAEVKVEVSRSDQAVRIAVTNPGEPIAAEHLDRLFDRFYRVDGARESHAGNHGLGLAIVKAVAAMHGGTVFASSGEGRNTFGFTVGAA